MEASKFKNKTKQLQILSHTALTLTGAHWEFGRNPYVQKNMSEKIEASCSLSLPCRLTPVLESFAQA